MATINANIAISSSDITSSPIRINNSMTMMKAGTCHGLENTSGLVRRTFTATTEVDLVATGAQMYGTPTATTNANKLYIKNTGTSSTDYVSIGMGDATGGEELDDGSSKITLGKLYGGDWMLIPYHGATNVGDVLIAPSTAETTTVEWMLFFE